MLLSIDTSGSVGTIALAQREGESLTVLATAELAGKTYAAMLIPRLRALLEVHRASLRDLEAIIVVNGPGSFTGVRVGVSAVKGLAELFSTPVIAISRLRILAHNAQTPYAALDAGRGEFYFGSYVNGDDEALLSPQELRAAAPVFELAVCDEKAATAFPEARLIAMPTASDALAAALPRLLVKDFDDIEALDGNYLRRSDAELFAKPIAQSGKLQNA